MVQDTTDLLPEDNEGWSFGLEKFPGEQVREAEAVACAVQ